MKQKMIVLSAAVVTLTGLYMVTRNALILLPMVFVTVLQIKLYRKYRQPRE